MLGTADELDLINAALARLAGGVVLHLDEETSLAALTRRAYDTVTDAVLSRHRWQHLSKTAPLQRLADRPVDGYAYAYQPPADAITPPLALYADPARRDSALRDYAIEGREIHANVAALWGTFGRRLSPDQWTPALRVTMIAALAAELAVPVCDDRDMAATLRAEAFGPAQMQGTGGLFAQAIQADHAAAPPMPALLAGPQALLTYPVDWMNV